MILCRGIDRLEAFHEFAELVGGLFFHCLGYVYVNSSSDFAVYIISSSFHMVFYIERKGGFRYRSSYLYQVFIFLLRKMYCLRNCCRLMEFIL